ncbi:MAG: hypothetical protein EPN88_16420 [Bacteroidetes bacterium]|nr:MAG: hypothetical protein EPN88_16420 [Bacteroidota bacterium]
MITDYQIPEPFLFNPLKHHLGFIKEFINLRVDSESNYDIKSLIKELKHLGTSVMDIYTGRLSVTGICNEVDAFLKNKKILQRILFSIWTGADTTDFKIISISDGSQWTLKYHENEIRYVHIFPARLSPHSFRVKSNTLKSAVLYYIMIGKDYVSNDDLNKVRPLLGLSPINDSADNKAILEMIEILRVQGSS